MAALTASRNTPRQGAARERITVAVKANAKGFKGGITVVDATGYGKSAATATALIAMGMATADYDATGLSSGAISVDVEVGVFKFDNSGGDAVDITSVGSDVFLVDDHTVSKTNAGGNTQSRAGKCVRLDTDGVWVAVGLLI